MVDLWWGMYFITSPVCSVCCKTTLIIVFYVLDTTHLCQFLTKISSGTSSGLSVIKILTFIVVKVKKIVLRHSWARAWWDYLFKSVKGIRNKCPCPIHTGCNKGSFTLYRGVPVIRKEFLKAVDINFLKIEILTWLFQNFSVSCVLPTLTSKSLIEWCQLPILNSHFWGPNGKLS